MVVVERRGSDNRFDIYEKGSVGRLTVRVYGGLAYADLLPKPWNVTYTGLPLPGAGHWKEKFGPVSSYTVRYEMDQDESYDVIDGIDAGDSWPLWSLPPAMRHVRYFTVFDPPFMAGVMAIPATLALRRETYVFTLSEASPQNAVQERVTYAPWKSASKNRWPNDRVITAANFRLSYDPKTMVVHRAWFKQPNITVILESQSAGTSAAISFGTP